jgi:hypothetical protein
VKALVVVEPTTMRGEFFTVMWCLGATRRYN